ncbi:ankyrin repeat domain-containing protein [Rhodohalobacter sp. 8-1]|uniref:ankyrin repeat domain-containing protein n=1 Tax=Rhodohalobacter sp. 8-1 TaxID=3131972 RepID=UPI0030EB6693
MTSRIGVSFGLVKRSCYLHSSALSGDLQTVNASIWQGISLDEANELGRTALMFAAFNGLNEVINLLIENCAELNLENDQGRTHLMFTTSGPFPETISQLLVNGADVNCSDSVEEWTPLMYAAAEGNLKIIELLLEYGADASLEDKDGDRAIDFASGSDHTNMETRREQ